MFKNVLQISALEYTKTRHISYMHYICIPNITCEVPGCLYAEYWQYFRPGNDYKMDMILHVNAVCMSSYFYLCNVARIRRFLIQNAATLVCSLVTFRLDNLNILLIGAPDGLLKELLLIQNKLAKLVVKKEKA